MVRSGISLVETTRKLIARSFMYTLKVSCMLFSMLTRSFECIRMHSELSTALLLKILLKNLVALEFIISKEAIIRRLQCAGKNNISLVWQKLISFGD